MSFLQWRGRKTLTGNNKTKPPLFDARDLRARAGDIFDQGDPVRLIASERATVGDFDLNPDAREYRLRSQTPAAVLVPVTAAREPAVILTQRSDALPRHPGQIAFPGGKIDAGDPTPLDAALRETEEEIGLAREFIEVLGYLDPYETGTGYRILPVVGLIRHGFTLVPEPGEVAAIFEVPLAFLMTPENHQRHSREFSGVMRHFHAMEYDNRFIWGATAGILKNFYDRVYGR